MSSNPFISICIPAYQRPELVKRLLDSVTEQSFNDYEIIITDDTPGTAVEDVVMRYSQLPLQYSRNDPAAGTPGNWNLAMQKARGTWVQLLHADDWYAQPDSLAKFAAVCQKSNSSFVFCASKEIDKNGKRVKVQSPSPAKLDLLKKDPLALVADNLIGHPSVVLHKRDNSLQYNKAFKWVVDIDFYIRFLLQYPGFEYLDESLINIGIDEEQVSATAYKNPSIEIPEYLELISSLPEQERTTNRSVFNALWILVKKFRIRNWDYIRDQGYGGTPTAIVEFIIRYQKKIPPIILKQTDWSAILANKCYGKWRKQLQEKKQ